MKIKIIIFFGLGLFLISRYGFEAETVAMCSPESDLGKKMIRVDRQKMESFVEDRYRAMPPTNWPKSGL